MNVFIVEDIPQARRELVDLLAGKQGFEVVSQAGSVREALDGIEATLPDAIILDVSLPDGSGVEILRHIRRRGWDPCVNVLTGNPYNALREKCRPLSLRRLWTSSTARGQALEALLAQPPRPGNEN